jgi:hypothetical protein
MEDGSSARARLLAYLAAGGIVVGAAYMAYSHTKKLVEVRSRRAGAQLGEGMGACRAWSCRVRAPLRPALAPAL